MIGDGDCCDFDNFDGDIAPSVPCMVAHGLRYAYVGCQELAVAEKQVRDLQAGGVCTFATYAFLYFGKGEALEVRKAVDVSLSKRVPYVVMDVEAVSPNEAAGLTPADRIKMLWASIRTAEDAGKQPAIYTGGPYWKNQMGNTTEFSRYPLILASYWENMRKVGNVSFGGWTDVWVHQYASAGVPAAWGPGGAVLPAPPLCGVNVDYNKVIGSIDMASVEEYEDLLLAAFSGPEDGGTREERLVAARYRVAQRVGKAPDGSVANSLLDLAASASVAALQANEAYQRLKEALKSL